TTALQAGDTFQLFSTNVTGAFAVTNLPTIDLVNNLVYTWTNKLAINGTIKVLTVAPNVNVNLNPTNITATVSGNVLTLAWPSDYTGWHLQIQTNSLSTGLGNNWVTLPGSDAVNTVNFTIDPANGAVFYRMV